MPQKVYSKLRAKLQDFSGLRVQMRTGSGNFSDKNGRLALFADSGLVRSAKVKPILDSEKISYFRKRAILPLPWYSAQKGGVACLYWIV